MPPVPKEPRNRSFLCIPLPPRRKKARNEEVQLKDGPAPTPAVKTLEQQLTEERNRYARLEQEFQRARTEAEASAQAKRKLEDEVRQVKELSETREKEVGQKDAKIRRLENDASGMREKLARPDTSAARIKELAARLDEKDKLLTERTTELNAAQAFLTRVDAVSEAEVVGMVDNLNTLISSASGALSDVWDQRDPVPGTLVDDLDSEQVRDNFGELMSEQIAARNSVAVTLAIQMCLVYFIERVTSSWGDGAVAGALGEIYGMISTKEGQTIASRWRTLTKRYAPHQEPPQAEEVIGGLTQILMVTRSFSDSSEAKESAVNSAETEIKAIIEATLLLDDTIKTKIASSDMSVYIVPRGATFAEDTMEDEFKEDGSKEEGGEHRTVAGTMEIGLVQKMGGVEKVLRKPKVILERDLVEPESEGKE